MRRLTPIHWMAIALAALVVIGLVYVYATRNGGAGEDRLGDPAQVATAERPEKRCSASRTYDAIKRDLFRRAAETRGTNRSAFDQIAAYSSLRVENPLLDATDEDLGTLRCTARVVLDLPPGTQVVGGRTSLAAEIRYVIQPAADGSGDVVMVDGHEPITVPLATLARTGGASSDAILVPPPLPERPLATPDPMGPELGPPPPEEPRPDLPSVVPPPPAPTRATASPSFNCRNARTRGELAVCADPRLAALDRQMASQYVRAVSAGSSTQRALLSRTRNDFLRHRDSCPSDACIAETYRGRMREIADIMSGRWDPGR